jgi:hypothetical protein
MKLVRVLWRDAHACAETWADPSALDPEPLVVDTVGWLIEDGKPEHLVVCQSLADSGMVDHVLAIPAGMVVRVTEVPVPCSPGAPSASC